MEGLSFRIAGAADQPLVRGLTERAYAVWLPVLGYPPQPVTDEHAPRIARGEVLLAEEAGRVVGLIEVEPGAGEDLIFNLAVEPDCGGRGFGPRLVAEAERRARETGKARMRLYTNALMARNIALYARLGYRETGRRENAGRPGFFIVDMEKAL